MLISTKLLPLGRILTISEKTSQVILHRSKCKQFYSSLTPCFSHVETSKKLNSYPIIKPETNSTSRRRYSDLTSKTKNLIQTCEVYIPSILFDECYCLVKSFWINQVVDKTFRPHQFRKSSKLVLKSVSRLISEKRLSELKGLVTSKCFKELERNIDNWNPNKRQLLAVSDSDFIVSQFYNVEEIMEDDVKGIQVSMHHHIFKVTENLLGVTFLEANYKFIKWLRDDESTEWIVSGINHFQLWHL